MIVPWHDPDEMIQVNDFDSQPGFFSGGPSGVDEAVRGRVNPRRIGFVRETDLDIPIFWEEDE